MKLLHISIISLLFTLIFNTTSFSKHLKGKSKKVHDEYLEKRIVGSRSKFNNIKIQPANDIKSLNKKLIENKNTKKIDKIIKKKSLLSVLYFDGENIVVDKKSEKIKNDTKLYSFSISKSFLSYILGNAICDGYIKSLDDKISKYVPEAKGTLYENSTFKELIDMAAGDKNFASREPGSAKLLYAVDVMGRKTTTKDYLLSSSGIKISHRSGQRLKFNPLRFSRLVVRRSNAVGALRRSRQRTALTGWLRVFLCQLATCRRERCAAGPWVGGPRSENSAYTLILGH